MCTRPRKKTHFFELNAQKTRFIIQNCAENGLALICVSQVCDCASQNRFTGMTIRGCQTPQTLKFSNAVYPLVYLGNPMEI